MIAKLLSPRWIFTTLLVMMAVAVMIRLGFWQLDRLEWRRDLNQRILGQLNSPPLNLNNDIPVTKLFDMEYRMIQVSGVYDYEHEFLWRNQVWENQPGYHLFTPLRIEGSDWVIYVNRGWIPLGAADAKSRLQYRRDGMVTLSGMLRQPMPKPAIGGVADPPPDSNQPVPDAWNWIDLERWRTETGLNLLPVWVQEAPHGVALQPPFPSLPEIEISEGPHFGYALQWFSFAAILALGYPFFVRKQLENNNETSNDKADESTIHTGEEIYEH
ncbi:MAG: SURF1-like protein [Bellilinea sp.]|nr:MAG: SURF1-like protein [Bellilinea sp.]